MICSSSLSPKVSDPGKMMLYVSIQKSTKFEIQEKPMFHSESEVQKRPSAPIPVKLSPPLFSPAEF
jgi:hypothetical protein